MNHRLVLLTGAGVLVAGCQTSHRVDFTSKLQPGTEVCYVLNAQEETIRKVESAPDQPPQETKSTLTEEVGMRLRCLEVKDDGSAVLEWRLLYLAIANEGRMAFTYDSRDPLQADAPESYIFIEILNRPANVTVDATGRVTDYRDPLSLGGGLVRFFMGSFFSRQAFEELGLAGLPGAPAGATVGATWSQSEPLEQPSDAGKVFVTSQFEFVDLAARGKTAEIKLEGTLRLEPPDPAQAGAPPEQKITLDQGAFSGRVSWDCVARQVISKELTSKVVRTVKGPSGKATFEESSLYTLKRLTTEEFQTSAAKPCFFAERRGLSPP